MHRAQHTAHTTYSARRLLQQHRAQRTAARAAHSDTAHSTARISAQRAHTVAQRTARRTRTTAPSTPCARARRVVRVYYYSADYSERTAARVAHRTAHRHHKAQPMLSRNVWRLTLQCARTAHRISQDRPAQRCTASARHVTAGQRATRPGTARHGTCTTPARTHSHIHAHAHERPMVHSCKALKRTVNLSGMSKH